MCYSIVVSTGWLYARAKSLILASTRAFTMTWRLQLPQPLIRRVDLLIAATNVVAAWTQTDRIHFYDQRNGKLLGERIVEKMASMERQSERWRAFVNGLRAPNDVYLPYVRTGGIHLLTTEDGKIRLYHLSGQELVIEVGSKESPLEIDTEARITAVDLDLALGLVAVLDQRARLHIFQQRIRVGAYETGLSLDNEFTPLIFVPHGGKHVVVTDGQQIAIFDATGKARKRLELHYPLGVAASSPDGKLLATTDAETGVLRVHDTDDMTLAYQRFAIDLAADARRLNAGAGAQPPTNLPGTLAVSNRGVLAFGLGGLLCVTSVSKMKALSATAIA